MTAGFKLLLETPANTPKNSQELPALEATIQGLQLPLQEKDQRIQDLKRENERLDFYALYFKSQDYKRLETSTREVKPEYRITQRSLPGSPGGAQRRRSLRRLAGTAEQSLKRITPGGNTANQSIERHITESRRS